MLQVAINRSNSLPASCSKGDRVCKSSAGNGLREGHLCLRAPRSASASQYRSALTDSRGRSRTSSKLKFVYSCGASALYNEKIINGDNNNNMVNKSQLLDSSQCGPRQFQTVDLTHHRCRDAVLQP